MSLRTLMLALLLAACGPKPAPSPPQPPGGNPGGGTLTGTVAFVGSPCPAPNGPPCDGPYPNYEVVVYASDGTTVAAKTTTKADGTFSLELPPGKYVIFTQSGIKATDRQRTDVDVSRDALAKIDLHVDTGVR